MVSELRQPIERLAARRLFAVVVDATLDPDVIDVSVNATELLVTLNGVTTSYPLVDADFLQINASDGADTINLNSLGTIPTSVDGGAGNDTLTIGAGNWRANVLADVTLRGGLGTDTAIIDDSLAPAATITLTNPFNIDSQFAIAGAGTIFVDAGTPDSSVEMMELRTGGEADQINVLGFSSFTSLRVLSGAGDDSIIVGNDYDSVINGPLSLDGGEGVNALIVDDSADAFGDAYLFSGTVAAPTFGKDSIATLLSYSNFATFHLIAGAGGSFPNGQFFRVTALPAALDLTIDAGSGDDALTLGTATLDLATIQATIHFNGEAGFDRIDVLDQVGTDAATYSVSPASLAISGQMPIEFTSLQSLNVRANGANNLMEVIGTTAPTSVTLDGGAGNDEFRVGNGDIDTTVGNGISVTGGAGIDKLILDDTLDDVGNDTYTFIAGLMNRAQRGILWSTAAATATETVELLGSANADTIRVSSASPTVTLRINAGDGNDTILLDKTDDSVNPPVPIYINSGNGDDSLSVNADGVGTDAVAAIDANVESLAQLSIRAGGRLNVVLGGDKVLEVRSSFSVAGTLDLNDQTLIIAAGSFSQVNQYVANGYNAGTWTTTTPAAIVSTVASQSTTMDALATVLADFVALPVYNGIATASGDIIVRYTLAGDATLDRVVGFDDLLALAQTYDPQIGGRMWSQGNFNYLTEDNVAGAVGFDDLLILAQNYGNALLAEKPATPKQKSRTRAV